MIACTSCNIHLSRTRSLVIHIIVGHHPDIDCMTNRFVRADRAIVDTFDGVSPIGLKLSFSSTLMKPRDIQTYREVGHVSVDKLVS